MENSVEVHTLGGFCLTDCLYCSLVYCLCWYLVHSLCWYLVYCLYCFLVHAFLFTPCVGILCTCLLPMLVSACIAFLSLPMLVSACIAFLFTACVGILFTPYVWYLVHSLCWYLMQIECINDGIGMVYSGMGPDFRLVTDTSLLLLLLLLIPLSVVSCHYPSLV